MPQRLGCPVGQLWSCEAQDSEIEDGFIKTTGFDEPDRLFSDSCEGSKHHNFHFLACPLHPQSFYWIRLQSLNLAPRMIKVGRRGILEASATTSHLSPFRRIQIRRCLSKGSEPKKRLQLHSWANAWNPAIQLAKIIDTKPSHCGILSGSEITTDSAS